MSGAALAFLAISWTLVLSLVGWSYYRILGPGAGRREK